MAKKREIVIEEPPFVLGPKKRQIVLMDDDDLRVAKLQFPGLVFREKEPGDTPLGTVTSAGVESIYRKVPKVAPKPIVTAETMMGGVVGGIKCRHGNLLGTCSECSK